MNQDQQPQPWWKDNWPVLALVPLVLMITTMTVLGYLLDWEWTGLVGIPENPETRTAWDWLGLLIIPVLLGAGALWFNQRARKGEQEQRQNESEIADQQRKEDSLQRYLDIMQGLILDKGLRRSEKGAEIRDVARVRTLAVLRSLDGNRKGQVLRFLHEAELIAGETEEGQVIKAIINLETADLSGAILIDANLSGANLSAANLSAANLTDADLSGAHLIFANLSDADLRGANLSLANLIDAQLSRANLSGAVLYYTFLGGANLSGANLTDADLSSADLSLADLSGADLSNADLTEANLRDANLSKANLSHAKNCTKEQLAQAESLVGAMMPKGTRMTEEAWEEFKKSYRQSPLAEEAPNQ